MSTNTGSNPPQELDLTDIFAMVNHWRYSLLSLGYRAFRFCIKKWWVFLILLIAGFAIGYIANGKPTYKASLVVQINFDSHAYVYNAIEQYNTAVKDKDTVFLNSKSTGGFQNKILKIEIRPVVDVVDLIKEVDNNSKVLTTLIKELEVDDDTELLASDRFYSNYKTHFIELTLEDGDAKSQINNVLHFINSQPYAIQAVTEGRKNLDERIAQNEVTITQIDKLVNNFSTAIGSQLNPSKVASNNVITINLQRFFVDKTELIKKNALLKDERVAQQNVMVVLSDIKSGVNSNLWSKKHIILPILLVLLYLFFSGVIHYYSVLGKTLKAKNLI